MHLILADSRDRMAPGERQIHVGIAQIRFQIVSVKMRLSVCRELLCNLNEEFSQRKHLERRANKLTWQWQNYSVAAARSEASEGLGTSQMTPSWLQQNLKATMPRLSSRKKSQNHFVQNNGLQIKPFPCCALKMLSGTSNFE